MRRTSLVLAVVAVMVTVLVVAAPAFAISLPEASDPAGPGGKNPETGNDNRPPENIGGQSTTNIAAPEGTTGELATDYTTHAHEVGAPAGHHVIDATPYTPGELVQLCRDFPAFCPDF